MAISEVWEMEQFEGDWSRWKQTSQRKQILRLILFDGLRPALLGLILGLAASTGATQLIRSMLYGTKPYDPPVIATVIFTLLLIALIACIFPAWRASRLDPMQALRTE